MEQELVQRIENALNGMETFKTDLSAKAAKLDAFDREKFDRIVESVGNAAEESQKSVARLKALEEGQKAIETALNRAPSGGHLTDEQKQKEFARKQNRLFNEFARLKSSNLEDFELFLGGKAASDPELKAMSVGSDPDGGYLVMAQFGGIISTKVYESSPIRQLASVTQISTDTLELVVDNDEADGQWVSEAGTRNVTGTPQHGKITIPVHEMYDQPKATQKLLDDAIIDVEAWLSAKVAEKFARIEATAFVSGNGVGKPKGLLSYAAGADIAAGQVEQVSSGSAGAITRTGLVNVQNALKEPYQANATWLAQRASLAAIMELKNGIGDPIFDSMFDKNVGLELTIMGRPLRFAADMPTIAPNALSVLYGDIRTAYQVVDRMGIRVLRDPYTDKPFIKFYTTRRVGGAVVNFEAYKLMKLAA